MVKICKPKILNINSGSYDIPQVFIKGVNTFSMQTEISIQYQYVNIQTDTLDH